MRGLLCPRAVLKLYVEVEKCIRIRNAPRKEMKKICYLLINLLFRWLWNWNWNWNRWKLLWILRKMKNESHNNPHQHQHRCLFLDLLLLLCFWCLCLLPNQMKNFSFLAHKTFMIDLIDWLRSIIQLFLLRLSLPSSPAPAPSNAIAIANV